MHAMSRNDCDRLLQLLKADIDSMNRIQALGDLRHPPPLPPCGATNYKDIMDAQ